MLMKTIYAKLKKKNLSFSHVCEVGVYMPETSNVLDFIEDGISTSLVDADPVIVEKIKSVFAGFKNITIYPVAVWDFNGTIKLSKAAASSFVSDLKDSPALTNDKYKVSEENTVEVESKVFSEIDNGSIDLLSIDIEGSEWFVIKHLKSRPKIISIETHGKFYVNPYMSEICNWIAVNNYTQWYKDGSDTVFVRKDVFVPSTCETIKLQLVTFKHFVRRQKRHLYKLVGK
jgi:FkbM family methyltransferase